MHLWISWAESPLQNLYSGLTFQKAGYCCRCISLQCAETYKKHLILSQGIWLEVTSSVCSTATWTSAWLSRLQRKEKKNAGENKRSTRKTAFSSCLPLNDEGFSTLPLQDGQLWRRCSVQSGSISVEAGATENQVIPFSLLKKLIKPLVRFLQNFSHVNLRNKPVTVLSGHVNLDTETH